MVTIAQGLSDVQDFFSDINSRLGSQPFIAGASGLAAGALIGGATVAAVTKIKKTRGKTNRKKNIKSRKSGNGKNKRSKSRKKSSKSSRKIRVTKNGQPYIITASGKARFISKKSAKASRKRKGGRY